MEFGSFALAIEDMREEDAGQHAFHLLALAPELDADDAPIPPGSPLVGDDDILIHDDMDSLVIALLPPAIVPEHGFVSRVTHKGRPRFYYCLPPNETDLFFGTIQSYLEERSPHAQERRRTATTTAPGASIPGLLEYLRKIVPTIMAKMKVDAVQLRRIFSPPTRANRAAQRYWDIIHTRMAHGENSQHEDHPTARSPLVLPSLS
jgi:hypothetical protein